jgi:hypothetical protein
MNVPTPVARKAVTDGVYIGLILSADTVLSPQYGKNQIEMVLKLNTREETKVWINQTAKGMEQLYECGAAEILPDGATNVHESDYLVGVVVRQGKGALIKATMAVNMNPALKPLWAQIAMKYGYK